MNVRRFVVMLFLMLPGLFPAQSFAAATLPADVRTTTNAIAVRPAIQKFIDTQIAQLNNPLPSAQSAGRDAIIAEVQPPGPTQPALSAIFLDAYADVLNTALLPLANNPDARVRLNVAIAAARVAEAANNARLMPVVVDLLDDKSDAVLIWAIKASKFLMPQVLSNAVARQNNPIVPAFVKAVSSHGQSGPIMQAAYEALRVDSALVPTAAWNSVVPMVVSTMHGVIQNRIALYRNAIPALPSAEALATTFLSNSKVWKAQPPAEALQTVQLIVDLVSVASQRWATANISERQDLGELINKATQAVWVIGDNIGADALKKPADQKMIPSTPAVDVANHAAAIRTALQGVPDFAGLKPSPSLDPIAATTSAPSESQ